MDLSSVPEFEELELIEDAIVHSDTEQPTVNEEIEDDIAAPIPINFSTSEFESIRVITSKPSPTKGVLSNPAQKKGISKKVNWKYDVLESELQKQIEQASKAIEQIIQKTDKVQKETRFVMKVITIFVLIDRYQNQSFISLYYVIGILWIVIFIILSRSSYENSAFQFSYP